MDLNIELTMAFLFSHKLLHDLIVLVVCVTVFMACDTTIHAHTHMTGPIWWAVASVYTTLDTRTQEELQQRMFEAAHHGYTRALEELLNAGVPVDKQHESVSLTVHVGHFAFHAADSILEAI